MNAFRPGSSPRNAFMCHQYCGLGSKRIIEGKREEIHADYLAALEDRLQGRIRSGSVSELFGNI